MIQRLPICVALLVCAFAMAGPRGSHAQAPAPAPAVALPPELGPATPAAPSPVPAVQGPELRVILPSGPLDPIPVTSVGLGRYISTNQLTNALLRKIQPDALIELDGPTGYYSATVLKNEFILYSTQSRILINKGEIETPDRLVSFQGQYYVPLSSVERILAHLDGVQSNIRELVQLSPAPVPTGTPRATAPPRPAPGTAATAAAARPAPAVAAGPADAAGDEAGIDPAAIAETLRLLTGQKTATAPRDMVRSLRDPAVLGLVLRHTIVLDPEPNPRLGEGAGDVPDLTLQVAQGCRQYTAGLDVVLTRTSGGPAGTIDERVDAVNTAQAKALVSLRIDWSEFPENCGYRLYAMHEAIDPEALQWRGSPDISSGPTRPQQLTYLPYENASLVLARLVQGELDKGQPAAPDPLVLAPHYLLRRAAMPAVTLSLGSWSCAADRARMSQREYADTLARSLAQSLLRYDDWLRSMAGGVR